MPTQAAFRTDTLDRPNEANLPEAANGPVRPEGDARVTPMMAQYIEI